MSANPVLGATIDVQLGNASGGVAMGCLIMGFAQGDTAGFGGTFLVDLAQVDVLPVHPLPPGGTTRAYDIPDDPLLCGLEVFAQLVHDDPGAPAGYAFSRGLRLLYGLQEVPD